VEQPRAVDPLIEHAGGHQVLVAFRHGNAPSGGQRAFRPGMAGLPGSMVLAPRRRPALRSGWLSRCGLDGGRAGRRRSGPWNMAAGLANPAARLGRGPDPRAHGMSPCNRTGFRVSRQKTARNPPMFRGADHITPRNTFPFPAAPRMTPRLPCPFGRRSCVARRTPRPAHDAPARKRCAPRSGGVLRRSRSDCQRGPRSGFAHNRRPSRHLHRRIDVEGSLRALIFDVDVRLVMAFVVDEALSLGDPANGR
jgi:hypothetical protein